MPAAVIYTRVSSKDQVKNLSLETQEKACIEYCQRHDFQILRIFREEGESAKTSQRTVFQQMLAFCREYKSRIDCLVVYSLSRFARDKYSHAVVRTLLSKLGITLRSTTEPIDDSSTGKLMEGVLAAIAQFDNDLRGERTAAGLKAAKEKGRWPHPAPIGYQNVLSAEGIKTLEPHPETGDFIRKAFEMAATGGSHCVKSRIGSITWVSEPGAGRSWLLRPWDLY